MSDKDWVRRPHEPGRFERLEAYFAGYGFAPHRHDTYAIGCTLAGVHRFNYRNCSRYSLPGDTIVLHPDELHDGEAGSEAGFRYRIVYIEPALLQGALGGQALPFINEGVSRDPRMQRAVQACCRASTGHSTGWRSRMRYMTLLRPWQQSPVPKAGAAVWITVRPSEPGITSTNS